MKESIDLVRKDKEIQELAIAEDVVLPPPTVNYGYNYDIEAEDEFYIRDYWRAVKKRLWLVFSIAILLTMLVAIYMARHPDIYQADARVQVNLDDGASTGGASKSGPIVLGNTNDPAYFNTQLQLLNSPGLLRRVVKTLDLERNPNLYPSESAQNSTWENLKRMVGLGNKEIDDIRKKEALKNIPLAPSIAPATEQEDLAEAKRLEGHVKFIRGSLIVEPVKELRSQTRETRLIDIRFLHHDPELSANIVNAVIKTFIVINLERNTQRGKTASEFLDKRVAELQAKIKSDEQRLIDYGNSKKILSLEPGQNTVVDRLAALNRQLIEAENTRKAAEVAYKTALEPNVADAQAGLTAAQNAESKLEQLRQEREKLLVEVTEEMPEVKAIDKQIAVLEEQKKNAQNRANSVYLTRLKTTLDEATAREQILRADFERQKSETLSLNEAAINYNIIKQEIETNKSLLDGLLKSARDVDVLQAGIPNNISVIDYATVPTYPVGPQRLRNTLVAFGVSLILGIGLALFLEYLDDSVRSTADIERHLHLPALAAIPAIGNGRRRRLISSGNNALQVTDEVGEGIGSEIARPELIINADAHSSLAEAYRQLRTSVLLSTPGHAPKTILVTSSQPAEGKTTTSVNTAAILAQTGASVLIIDADMRRPRLHEVFGLSNERGLSTILSSNLTEAEVLTMIRKRSGNSPYVLVAGPPPPNPAELLASEQMHRLLAMLETTFTHIVIDSPPVVHFTDSVLMSSIVDGVLLVVHSGKSSRQIVRRARKSLQDVGARILGVVLNQAGTESPAYYYYYE